MGSNLYAMRGLTKRVLFHLDPRKWNAQRSTLHLPAWPLRAAPVDDRDQMADDRVRLRSAEPQI